MRVVKGLGRAAARAPPNQADESVSGSFAVVA